MKKQIIHTIALISAILVSSQAFCYTWTLKNASNHAINATIDIECGPITGQWKSIPAGQTYNFDFAGGAAGCAGSLMINDYIEFNDLGNITIPGSVMGGSFTYKAFPSENSATLGVPMITVCPEESSSSCITYNLAAL